MNDLKKLLTEKQPAKTLGLKCTTLRYWRWAGRNKTPYIKVEGNRLSCGNQNIKKSPCLLRIKGFNMFNS